jgi:Ca-activated chloride channel homolog
MYSAGRKRMPLHKSKSFWLEILCAICLSITIAEPMGCTSKTSPHYVIVVDTSASMNAGSYWFDLQNNIVKELKSAANDSLFTIIQAGSIATITAGPNVPLAEAVSTLQKLTPFDTNSDLESALDIASSLTSGTIDVYTDKPPPKNLSLQISWNSQASPRANVGIIKAKRSYDKVDISLWNASDLPNKGKLIITFTEKQIEEKELSFNADEIQHFHLTLSEDYPAIDIQFVPAGADGLALDNNVVLLRPESRVLKVGFDIDSKIANSLGLQSNTDAKPPIFRIAESIKTTTPMDADILFTDRNLGGGPETWRVSIHTSNDQLQTAQRSLFINHRHPLLQDINLNNVVWTYSNTKQIRGTPLIENNKIPLLSEELQNKGERKIYHFNISPLLSTLQTDQAWPILLSEFLEERRSFLPGLVQANLKSNQSIQVLDATSGNWKITTPFGVYEKQHSGGTLQIPAKGLGVHTLQLAEETYQASIALLSREETDLRTRQSISRKSEIQNDQNTQPSKSILSIFLIVALLTMALDWKATEINA